jgi:hypothetical protein
MVYGTSGFCDLRGEQWTETGCITFRGGEYSMITSDTRKVPSADSYPVDKDGYPNMNFVSDNVRLNDNHTLTNFPMGIALSDWGEQAYHNMMAIGMGTNSTMLSSLKDTGKIAARVWGMFWGRDGATRETQLNGSMVFGGYDKAKVVGEPYTQFLVSDRSVCSTGMLVTITDLVLNFPNGTNASLFPPAKTSSISACIVPDYPVLMTLPNAPYFNNFRTLTNAYIEGRSLGIDFYSVRYSDGDVPYTGDLTIELQDGLSVRVPNDQLVVPDRYSDSETGQWVVNSTDPTIVINAIQDVNGNDLSQLGRQFLSAAYLMVNEETGQFNLWPANPTLDEDLVAFDANGKEADSICSEPSSTNTTANPDASASGVPIASPSDKKDPAKGANRGLSTGAIAGVVIAVVAVGALSLGLGVWLWRRKKARKAAAQQEEFVQAVVERFPKAQDTSYATELPDSSGQWPQEIYTEGTEPSPGSRYELAGSTPTVPDRDGSRMI